MNIEEMQAAKRKAQHDTSLKRLNEEYSKSQMNGLLGEVNCPVEVAMLLKKLNDAVTLMYELSDDYYTDYIFNASTPMLDRLKREGFNEEYFMKLADRLEMLRSILYGEALNFDNVYRAMQDEIMVHEYYWREFYEEVNQKLRYENEQLKKERGELK